MDEENTLDIPGFSRGEEVNEFEDIEEWNEEEEFDEDDHWDEWFPIISTAFDFAINGVIEGSEHHLNTLYDVWGDQALWVAARSFIEMGFEGSIVTKLELDTLMPDEKCCEDCGEIIEKDREKKFIMLCQLVNDDLENPLDLDFWMEVPPDEKVYFTLGVLDIASRYADEMMGVEELISSLDIGKGSD